MSDRIWKHIYPSQSPPANLTTHFLHTSEAHQRSSNTSEGEISCWDGGAMFHHTRKHNAQTRRDWMFCYEKTPLVRQKWEERMTLGPTGGGGHQKPCRSLSHSHLLVLHQSLGFSCLEGVVTHTRCVSQCVVSRQDSGTAQFIAKSIYIVGLSVLVCMFFFLQRDSSQENKDCGHLWCIHSQVFKPASHWMLSFFHFFFPKSELHLGGN